MDGYYWRANWYPKCARLRGNQLGSTFRILTTATLVRDTLLFRPLGQGGYPYDLIQVGQRPMDQGLMLVTKIEAL